MSNQTQTDEPKCVFCKIGIIAATDSVGGGIWINSNDDIVCLKCRQNRPGTYSSPRPTPSGLQLPSILVEWCGKEDKTCHTCKKEYEVESGRGGYEGHQCFECFEIENP
tara:strand:- start:118 stop:444 length:327 start_codon:yes stop_codon:yes gene_type:complete